MLVKHHVGTQPHVLHGPPAPHAYIVCRSMRLHAAPPSSAVTRLSTGRLPDHARRMSLSDAMVLDANGHVRMSVAGAPPRVPPAPLDLSTAGSDAEQGGSSHLLATFAGGLLLQRKIGVAVAGQWPWHSCDGCLCFGG